MIKRGILFAWVLLSSAGVAIAQESFQLGTVAVSPGTMASGRIEIAASGGDDGTFVPITVVHGARRGPVLALIAGVHGAEYSPILALQRLSPLLGPKEVSGTVVIVHAANLPAFLGRTIYYSPDDWKNLNRSFPGKAKGSLTERIAHALTHEVIERADYVMDIHSGDGNEMLRPSYTGYYAEAGGADVIERSKRMAIAFGLDTIVAFKGDLEPERAIWCGSAAVARGIPSIDVESGELGLVEERRIEPIVEGILSVMRDLEMLAGEPTPTREPLIIHERAYVKSEHDGIWHPDSRIEAGQFVSKGARLGVLTDFFGNQLFEARAPESGMLLIMLGTPPVNAGETIAVIANVGGEPW
ncbi:MAG: M14 family metallopeptidase [Acidobacteriota bacterium]